MNIPLNLDVVPKFFEKAEPVEHIRTLYDSGFVSRADIIKVRDAYYVLCGADYMEDTAFYERIAREAGWEITGEHPPLPRYSSKERYLSAEKEAEFRDTLPFNPHIYHAEDSFIRYSMYTVRKIV